MLSHASLVDRRMWQPQLAALSPHYDVIAFDQLGYGDPSSAPAAVRPAETLLRVLDALDIGHATLVGASMGGGYSLDAALLAPERVSVLVLICSGASRSPPRSSWTRRSSLAWTRSRCRPS